MAWHIEAVQETDLVFGRPGSRAGQRWPLKKHRDGLASPRLHG
jgi:hypothetical protein